VAIQLALTRTAKQRISGDVGLIRLTRERERAAVAGAPQWLSDEHLQQLFAQLGGVSLPASRRAT